MSKTPSGIPLFIATGPDGQQTPGITQIRPLSGIKDGIGEGAIMAVFLMANGGNSGVLPLHFTLDSALPPFLIEGNAMLDTFSRGLLLSITGDGYYPARELDPTTDGQTAGSINHGLTGAMARLQAYDGTDSYDRVRLNSAAAMAAAQQPFGLMAASPGEWAIQHTPAAATQATITRAAGGAGVRHVCRSITCSVAAVNAQGQIIVNLRDGATGAGTILWSAQFVLAAGTSDRITLAGLNIVGSANTAMTLEVAAAPAAGNFASVALTGYDTV